MKRAGWPQGKVVRPKPSRHPLDLGPALEDMETERWVTNASAGCRTCSGEDARDFDKTVEVLVRLGEEVDVVVKRGKESVALMRPDFAVWLVQHGWKHGFRGQTL